MDRVEDLLEKIQKNPDYFIGKKSLNDLVDFVYGYIFAVSQYEYIYSSLFFNFQEYVQKRYRITATVHWTKILRLYEWSDENAYDSFFEHYEQFIKYRKKYKNKFVDENADNLKREENFKVTNAGLTPTERLDILLEKVKNCPGVYFGRKRITPFYQTISGFTYGLSEFEKESLTFNSDFNRYIQKEYNIITTRNWGEVILFFSESEEQAFDRFYNHLNDFNSKK